MIAKERFYELRNQQGLINTEELDEVFNALEPVSCESILGKWKGGDFNTGHKGSAQLKEIKWYGKTFNSLKDAKPLICYNEKGELYSNQKWGGEASLWMIEFRGRCQPLWYMITNQLSITLERLMSILLWVL